MKLVVRRVEYFQRSLKQILVGIWLFRSRVTSRPILIKPVFMLSLSLAALISSCAKTPETVNSQEIGKPQTVTTTQPVTSTPTPQKLSDQKSEQKNETKTPDPFLSELKQAEAKKYIFKTGLFQIDVPKTWTVREVISKSQVGVIWVNPNRTLILGVQVSVNSKLNGIPSKAELAQVLPLIVKSNFGSRPDFEMSPVPIEPDTAPRVRWSYTSEQGKVQGFSDIQQDDDKLSVLSAGVLEKSASKEAIAALTKIFSTYKVDSIIPIGGS
jgi:hypothetical protein